MLPFIYKFIYLSLCYTSRHLLDREINYARRYVLYHSQNKISPLSFHFQTSANSLSLFFISPLYKNILSHPSVVHIFNKNQYAIRNSSFRRPDEVTFDDENDQLLYVRERVAYKFQEANGWIDTVSGNDHRRFTNEERNAIERTSKRLVDLSAPKFQTFEDRYEKFSRQRRLDIQKLGLASSYSIDDAFGNDERVKKMDDRARSPGKGTERDERMGVFSVRTGPSVNIKGDLVAQNLGNIHISPDPSFTRENQNVGTYVVRRDFDSKKESSGRREKVARILEENAKDAEKLKKRNTEPDSGSDSARVSAKSERSGSADLTNIEKLDENVENVRETVGSLMKDSENFGSNFDEGTPRENLQVPTRGISNDSETLEQQEVKITFKSEQKQVRFEERRSEKISVNPPETECKNRLETEETTRILEEKNLRTPSTSIELEARRIANDKSEQYKHSSKQFKANDEHVPLSSREITKKHKANRKKHREIREDRYKEIDERFANIVRTHCDKDEERSKSCEECSNVLSSSLFSTEGFEESDDLNLYEPCINELDDVLVSYDKIIGDIVQSTRTIEKFLSRPELQEYRVEENSGKGEVARKSSDPASLNGEKIAETETDNSFDSQRKQSAMDLLRSRDEKIEMRNSRIKSDGARSSTQTELRKRRRQSSKEELKKVGVGRSKSSAIESKESPNRNSIEDGSLVASESLNEKRNPNEMKWVQAATPLSLKTSLLANFEDDTSKRRAILDKSAIEMLDLKMKDRLDRSAWQRRAAREETTAETSEDNTKNIETKQTFPRKARLFRIVNDSSSLTASSICPLTSSTDTKSANDTRLSEEMFKLSNNDEFLEKGTILKINPSETNEEDRDNCTPLQNVVSSDVLKGIILEKGRLENFMARLVTREDAKFAEDKAKSILGVNEIVVPVSLIESLLERLENDATYPENLRLLISERSPTNNNAASNVRTTDVESESEKRNSQLELPLTGNFAATETEGRCNGGEATSDKSENRKDTIVLVESIPRREERSSSKCNEIASRDGEDDKASCAIELEGSSKVENNEIDGMKSNFERNSENSISRDGVDPRANESDDENLISARTDPDVADESTASERCRTTQTLDNLPHVSKEDSKASNEKIKSFVENTGNDDDFVNKISQDSSDSLRDCASLRSSLRSLTNNTKPSREASELKRTETSNTNEEKIENRNNSHFDSMFEKEKILSDVYDEMNKKLFSSTCLDANTNYSSFLNQHR